MGVAAPPGVDTPPRAEAWATTSDTSIDTGSLGSPADTIECVGLTSMKGNGALWGDVTNSGGRTPMLDLRLAPPGTG